MSARESPGLSSDFGKLICSASRSFSVIHPYHCPRDERRPKGRSGHCMCSDESNLYVFGGYSPRDDRNGVEQSCVLPELWKFNFASQKWLKISDANTPETCASACLSVHGKQVFVFGGTGYPFGQIMSNTIKTLKLDSESISSRGALTAAGEATHTGITLPRQGWYLLDTHASSYSCSDSEDVMPRRAYGQSLLFHKGALYVFGGAVGYHTEAISDLHKLSLESKIWEKITGNGVMPSGRYKQEIAIYQDRFYVLGGGRLHYAEALNKVNVYDTVTNQWSLVNTDPDPVAGYPKPRCSFGCVQIGKHIYISGGRHYSVEVEHESLSDIWCLRLDTLSWIKLTANLPCPLYFHRAVGAPSGHMYIFGGVHSDGYRSPHMYKFRLPFSMPKLSELCWEIVSEKMSETKSIVRNDLVALGIPWNFLERFSF